MFDDNFTYFSSKPYVVTTHLNRLIKAVQMRGHNICFYAELRKLSLIITKYSHLSRALLNEVVNQGFLSVLVHIKSSVLIFLPTKCQDYDNFGKNGSFCIQFI